MRTLKIPFSDIAYMEKTRLQHPDEDMLTIANGSLSIYVRNPTGISANDFLVLEAFESEDAEIVQVASVDVQSHLVELVNATVIDHAVGVIIVKTPYDKLRIYKGTSNDVSTHTEITSFPYESLRPDNAYTYYTDTTGWLSSLTSDITSSEESMSAANAADCPDIPFTVFCGAEQIRVTAISGNTLTITRGYNSTTAVSHLTGAPIFSNYYSYAYHNSTSITAYPQKVYYPTGTNSIASPFAVTLPFNPITTQYLYIGSTLPFEEIDFTMLVVNTTAPTISTLKYWNGTAWTSVTITDSTIVGTGATAKTLGVTGSMTFTAPGDWIRATLVAPAPTDNLYWTRLEMSGILLATTQTSAITVTYTVNGNRVLYVDSNYDSIITVTNLKNWFMFGLDLTDDDGYPFPNSMFEFAIRAAIRSLEKTLQVKLIQEQIIDEKHDYYMTEYKDFAFLQLNQYPILSVERVAIRYPTSTSDVVFPNEWIQMQKAHGQIHLIPTSGSISNILMGTGGDYLNFVWRGWTFMPNLWHIDYTAGFATGTVPDDIIAVIGKMACFYPLNIAGDLVGGIAIASKSIGIDGLSQSINTTSSPENAGYSARLRQYERELKESIPKLIAYYKGIRMTTA